jgi:hypothetical protein
MDQNAHLNNASFPALIFEQDVKQMPRLLSLNVTVFRLHQSGFDLSLHFLPPARQRVMHIGPMKHGIRIWTKREEYTRFTGNQTVKQNNGKT